MKKKLGLDQTASWLLAFLAACMIFTGIYYLFKKMAHKQENLYSQAEPIEAPETRPPAARPQDTGKSSPSGPPSEHHESVSPPAEHMMPPPPAVQEREEGGNLPPPAEEGEKVQPPEPEHGKEAEPAPKTGEEHSLFFEDDEGDEDDEPGDKTEVTVIDEAVKEK